MNERLTWRIENTKLEEARLGSVTCEQFNQNTVSMKVEIEDKGLEIGSLTNISETYKDVYRGGVYELEFATGDNNKAKANLISHHAFYAMDKAFQTIGVNAGDAIVFPTHELDSGILAHYLPVLFRAFDREPIRIASLIVENPVQAFSFGMANDGLNKVNTGYRFIRALLGSTRSKHRINARDLEQYTGEIDGRFLEFISVSKMKGNAPYKDHLIKLNNKMPWIE